MPTAAAVVTGRSHRLQQHNCQDSAVAGEPAPGCAYGFIFDGCGSSYRDETGRHPSRTETGARLLAAFTGRWLDERLQPDADPTALAPALETALLGYLERLLAATAGDEPAARRRFTATHLLTTVAGFLVTPVVHAFVTAGDGFLVRNGIVCELEADNRPAYLAYRLLPDAPPAALTVSTCAPTAAWLATASDGWQAAQLATLAPPRSTLLLQRRLNQLSRQADYFADDGAIACWQRGEP